MMARWTIVPILLLLMASAALAQPDVRDSVIIESKNVGYVSGFCSAILVRVSITNADSLTHFTLASEFRTLSGTAYAILCTTRTFIGVINPLTNTLRYNPTENFLGYNNSSPDSFWVGAGYNPGDPTTIEPPNLRRKDIWELKFSSSGTGNGQMLLNQAAVGGQTTHFTNTASQEKPVNFKYGVITLNIDFFLTNCEGAGGSVLYGRPYSYDFDAGPPPASSWSVVVGPGSINSNGVYSFSGQCPLGQIPVTVQAATNFGAIERCQFTLNIIDHAPVSAPAQSVVSVSHGLLATNQINASDPDAGDGLVYSILSGPGTVNASGVWSYATGCEDVPISPQTIKIKVSDAFGNCNPGPKADTCQFQLVVTNSPPVFTWPASAPK